jgi:hypothetical protein
VLSHRAMSPPRSSFLLLLLAAALFGCAVTPRTIARDLAAVTPPVAINSTLHALNDDENQRLVLALLRSPELRGAARELSESVADGALGAMTEPERMARIERMSSRYVASLTRTVTRSMAEGMRRDLGPALVAMTRDAVTSTMRESLREALREEHQRAIERVVGGVTRSAVEAATRGASEGVARDLVPAIRDALLQEQTARALASATRSLAREAVLGSNEAMTQIQRQQERTGRPSFLSRISNLTEDGVKIMRMVTVVAVALALLLGAWVLRLYLRGRRIQAESERNAASAVLFAEAIRAAEGKPWSGELTDIIQQRLRGDAVSGMIDEVLKPRDAKGRNGHRASRPSSAPRHDA